MKTIALVGLRYDSNVGDQLLFECSEFILRKIQPELTIIHVDFFGRKKLVARKVDVNKPAPVINTYSLGQRRLYHSYYLKQLKNVDLVIIVGAGTLKWHARLDFGPRYNAVREVAKWYGIPIVLSCVGVESPFDLSDYRCRRLSRVLSDSSFRILTTRDDIDTLKQYVGNPDAEIARIADVGVWAAEVHGIKRNINSNLVGIGIICWRRFEEFNRGISKSEYEATISGIIEELNRRRQPWRFFCNGDEEDVVYMRDFASRLGLNDKCLPPPQLPKDLVNLVSSFKGVITSRLHSCIVSYSLKVPFVAIVWNEKLNYFAKYIGYPERAINKDRLAPGIILDTFDKALVENYEPTAYDKYRNTDKVYFKKYVELLSEQRNVKHSIWWIVKEYAYRSLLSWGYVAAWIYRMRKKMKQRRNLVGVK